MALEIIMLAICAVILLIVLFFVLAYNSLVTMRNRIDNAWSQIDVQLKLRHDLIPNLVETVKGYTKHEKTVFENVTKARAEALGAQSVGEKAKAEGQLSQALKSIFAVAEAYPQLQASENFKMLQEELSGIEGKIAYARQFYNDSVMTYNTSIQTVPTNFMAGMFNFAARDFFKAGEEERENVQVKF
ncbi:MAG: LemA family protein [Candidatus Micrarchaeota archaeon]|nr:LemA family protein [Candidatus Micrarchaeota archaeon]